MDQMLSVLHVKQHEPVLQAAEAAAAVCAPGLRNNILFDKPAIMA
jgi:hypothetical protein